MFGGICILIFPLLVLSRSIPISNATLDLDARDASPVEWFTEPWCIYHLDAFTDHWAVMIPDDGSKEEDGLDKAGHCGKKFKNHAVGGGITPTEWHCHYGPHNSACITFNSGKIADPAQHVECYYSQITDRDVKCIHAKKAVVCPEGFSTH